MKTQLKLASVAVMLTGLVLNTCAISLATVDDPPAMAVYYSEGIAHESGASKNLRLPDDLAKLQEIVGARILHETGAPVNVQAESPYQDYLARLQEIVSANIGLAMRSKVNASEAGPSYGVITADTELRDAVEQLLGSTASAYTIPAGTTASTPNDPEANLSGGEQVLWDIA